MFRAGLSGKFVVPDPKVLRLWGEGVVLLSSGDVIVGLKSSDWLTEGAEPVRHLFICFGLHDKTQERKREEEKNEDKVQD